VDTARLGAVFDRGQPRSLDEICEPAVEPLVTQPD
jgi:hypothetical protein